LDSLDSGKERPGNGKAASPPERTLLILCSVPHALRTPLALCSPPEPRSLQYPLRFMQLLRAGVPCYQPIEALIQPFPILLGGGDPRIIPASLLRLSGHPEVGSIRYKTPMLFAAGSIFINKGRFSSHVGYKSLRGEYNEEGKNGYRIYLYI